MTTYRFHLVKLKDEETYLKFSENQRYSLEDLRRILKKAEEIDSDVDIKQMFHTEH